MGGEIGASFRAALVAGDPALAHVVESVPRAVDLFDLIAAGGLRARPVIVLDDRARVPGSPHLRLWRPTTELLGPAVDALTGGAGNAVVLDDGDVPAGVAIVPGYDVRTVAAFGPTARTGVEARNVLAMMANYAQGFAAVCRAGGDPASHPGLASLAADLHRFGLQFSAAFREGVWLSTAAVPPPPQARLLAPEAWLRHRAGAPPDHLPPLPAPRWPLPRRPAAAQPPDRSL